jgi:hypothetical protein
MTAATVTLGFHRLFMAVIICGRVTVPAGIFPRAGVRAVMERALCDRAKSPGKALAQVLDKILHGLGHLGRPGPQGVDALAEEALHLPVGQHVHQG